MVTAMRSPCVTGLLNLSSICILKTVKQRNPVISPSITSLTASANPPLNIHSSIHCEFCAEKIIVYNIKYVKL